MALDKKDYELTGIKEVLDNINREYSKLKKKSVKGLIECSIDLYRAMDKEAPRIPVDTGNLRASYFSVTKSTKARGEAPAFKGKGAGELKGDHAQKVMKFQTELQKEKDPALVLGFTANYAIKVHEDVKGNFSGDPSKGKKGSRREGAGAKFMEAHLKKYESKFIANLKKHVDIP